MEPEEVQPPEVAEESRRSRTSHVSKERLVQWQKKLASRDRKSTRLNSSYQ